MNETTKRELNNQALGFLVMGIIIIFAAVIHTDPTVFAFGFIISITGFFFLFMTRP